MADEEEVIDAPEEPDIVDEYINSAEGELKDSLQEENLSDGDFDYQQGFGDGNYPQQPMKDSITKFYRDIISLMVPKKVVRVGNFTHKETRNCKIFLNYADYNEHEGNELIARVLRDMAVVETACSMGRKGFIVTNIMTQRRIVQRQNVASTQQPYKGVGRPPQQSGG